MNGHTVLTEATQESGLTIVHPQSQSSFTILFPNNLEGDESMAESCIPIVIGVTGHRNLRPEELEPLREVVTQQLKAL